jgi:hypothetical protein
MAYEAMFATVVNIDTVSNGESRISLRSVDHSERS